MVDTKDQSNTIVYTVNMKIKACNGLNAMFVETVDTLVFVALTQHLIQSTMRCENSTLLCIKWPLALIFNQFQSAKSFGKLRLNAFQLYHQYYICRYCQYRTRISNAFNAIYVNTVDIFSTQYTYMCHSLSLLEMHSGGNDQ